MATRRRRPRRRKYSRRRRLVRLAPKPRMKTLPVHGALTLAPSSATTVAATQALKLNESNDCMVVGINGELDVGIFHGSADQSVEVVLAFCTPLKDATTDPKNAVEAFDPFDDANWQAPAAIRGFNVVHLHRLANSHPAGAANAVYTLRRRFKRRFKRFFQENRSGYLALWASGNANVRMTFNAGVKYVVND